jgi:adenylate cyclase
MGDGILAEFASAVDAVQCAVDIQKAMKEENAKLSDDRAIVLRISMNLGDVVVEDGDLYGDGVNIAARLEAMCQPGGVCISRAARDQIRDKLDLSFTDLGELHLKNIERPVRAFSLGAASVAALPETSATLQDHGGAIRPVLPPPTKPSIAVLPFENLS